MASARAVSSASHKLHPCEPSPIAKLRPGALCFGALTFPRILTPGGRYLGDLLKESTSGSLRSLHLSWNALLE